MNIRLKSIWGLRSPAAISHDGKCDEILIDPAIWWAFSPQERKFIIEHELAHCRHNVYDEIEADRIGYDEFVKDGGNPLAAITALKRLGNYPSINERVETLIEENMYGSMTGNKWFQRQYPPMYSQFGPDEVWESGNGGTSGGWEPEDWNDLIGEVGGVVASILNGNRRYPSGYPQGGYPPPQQNNTLLFIGIAVVVVLLVLVLIKK